jgi:hypothetical protein
MFSHLHPLHALMAVAPWALGLVAVVVGALWAHSKVPDSWRVRRWKRKHKLDHPKHEAAAEFRRRMPIGAFVGGNGGGKTLAAVETLRPTLDGIEWACDLPGHLHTRRGVTVGLRTVLSTVELLDDSTGEPHLLCEPLTDYRQLLEAEHCDIFLDEVIGVMSASTSQSLPVQVESLIVQLRRRDNRLFWTTPSYGNAAKRLREVTQAVTYCSGFLQVPATGGRLWRERRGFRWATYDARDFDEFTNSNRPKMIADVVQFFWRPGSRAERLYSTLAPVTALGVATEGGMCTACGGTRSKPRCHCGLEVQGRAASELEVVETVERGVRRRQAVLVGMVPPPGAPQRSEERTGPAPNAPPRRSLL